VGRSGLIRVEGRAADQAPRPIDADDEAGDHQHRDRVGDARFERQLDVLMAGIAARLG
jgi:hypothetical protein